MQTGVKSFGCENSTAPAVAHPLVELDGPLGRLGREVGCLVAELQAVHCVVRHFGVLLLQCDDAFTPRLHARSRPSVERWWGAGRTRTLGAGACDALCDPRPVGGRARRRSRPPRRNAPAGGARSIACRRGPRRARRSAHRRCVGWPPAGDRAQDAAEVRIRAPQGAGAVRRPHVGRRLRRRRGRRRARLA